MMAAVAITACILVLSPGPGLADPPEGAATGEPAGSDEPEVTAPPANAPSPESSDAVRLYDEGLRQFRAGAYDEAIVLLKQAYDQAPIPALLYDLGQAYRLKGDCSLALGAYQRFLATGPTGRARSLAEARVGELQGCASELPNAPPASPANPTSPTAEPSATRAAEAAAPHAQQPDLRLARAPEPAAAQLLVAGSPGRDGPDGRGHAFYRRAAVVSSAVALAFGAAGGYFAWRAHSLGDDVSAAFVPGGTWQDVQGADQAGRRDDRLALASGAAALVSAGIAAWLFTR